MFCVCKYETPRSQSVSALSRSRLSARSRAQVVDSRRPILITRAEKPQDVLARIALAIQRDRLERRHLRAPVLSQAQLVIRDLLQCRHVLHIFHQELLEDREGILVFSLQFELLGSLQTLQRIGGGLAWGHG
ncbi:hypothetical protein HY213_00680 [Candidatus Peregrinibacteria bacterium]|nr:hypothetical protein [Candidatus Peregrinibacteria bacterium]